MILRRKDQYRAPYGNFEIIKCLLYFEVRNRRCQKLLKSVISLYFLRCRFELNSKSSELDSVKFMLIERKRELRSAETYLAGELKQLKTDNSILESKLSDLEQKLLTKQQQWQQSMQEQEERCTSLEKELGECGMKLIKKQEELEESKRATSAESENIIESLTMSRDMLRKELR